MVVGQHGHHLRPFPAAVFRAAVHPRQIEFQNHAAGLFVGVADAFRGFVVQYFAGRTSGRLSVALDFAAIRLPDVHGGAVGQGLPERF